MQFTWYWLTAACVHIVAAGQTMDEQQSEKYINKEDTYEMRKQLQEAYGDSYGEKWFLMPDGNGVPRVAMMEPGEQSRFWGFFGSDQEARDGEEGTLGEESVVPAKEIIFKLYTSKNKEEGQEISKDNPEDIKKTNYDPAKPTKIVIHGWKSSGESTTVLNIKDAYLQTADVNVIGTDWSAIASNNYYVTPMSETMRVGAEVAQLVDVLCEGLGAKYQDFHIVGHSLGAHVSGYAGSGTKQHVARITGLDPALPGFQYYQGTEGRLDDTDADFVEVIHTCSGALGMSSPAGHADFYPNGGSPLQPGCCCLPEFTEGCSHGRSHVYFAESIIYPKGFIASNCETWEEFKNDECKGKEAVMGEYTPTDSRGIYYLTTNYTSPYGMGEEGAKYQQ